MSSELQACDPEFDERVRASFAQQGLMSTFAAELGRVEPGLVEIAVPFADGLTQQDGFLRAGVVIAAMDSACRYAALTYPGQSSRPIGPESPAAAWIQAIRAVGAGISVPAGALDGLEPTNKCASRLPARGGDPSMRLAADLRSPKTVLGLGRDTAGIRAPAMSAGLHQSR